MSKESGKSVVGVGRFVVDERVIFGEEKTAARRALKNIFVLSFGEETKLEKDTY
jgi:hypothetical protein